MYYLDVAFVTKNGGQDSTRQTKHNKTSTFSCRPALYYIETIESRQTALPVKLLPEVLADVGGRRVPVTGPLLPAPLPPLVVPRDAVIPAPLQKELVCMLNDRFSFSDLRIPV